MKRLVLVKITIILATFLMTVGCGPIIDKLELYLFNNGEVPLTVTFEIPPIEIPEPDPDPPIDLKRSYKLKVGEEVVIPFQSNEISSLKILWEDKEEPQVVKFDGSFNEIRSTPEGVETKMNWDKLDQ